MKKESSFVNPLLSQDNVPIGLTLSVNEDHPLHRRNPRNAANERKPLVSFPLGSSSPLFVPLIQQPLSHAWRLRSPRCWPGSPVESQAEGAGRQGVRGGGRVVTNCPSPSPREYPVINADCLTLGPSSSVLTILPPGGGSSGMSTRSDRSDTLPRASDPRFELPSRFFHPYVP